VTGDLFWHLADQLLGLLFLLRDAVLVAEGTDSRVHAEEVEVRAVNLKHLLADALRSRGQVFDLLEKESMTCPSDHHVLDIR